MPITPNDVNQAAQIVGTAMDGIFQADANKKEKKYAQQIYQQTRADSLADWNMQNAYNSPAAQMARLKAAGLNPNLVYGSGAVANNSTAPRSPSTQSYSPKPVLQGTGDALQASLFAPLQKQILETQLSNLKKQGQNIDADVVKKSADVLYKNSSTDLNRFDLGQKNDLKETVIATANANLDRVNIGNNVMNAANDRAQDANERAAVMQAANLKIAAQNLLNMQSENLLKQINAKRQELLMTKDRQGIANMNEQLYNLIAQRRLINSQTYRTNAQTELDELEADFRQYGMSFKDPIALRMIKEALERAANSKQTSGRSW